MFCIVESVMDKVGSWGRLFFDSLCSFQRNCIFYVLSVGPISYHIAFIMDGNRRYAKKWNMVESAGHRVGFLALISMLRYCYELGLKYVTVYAFSIDNLKRKPEEVQALMDLMEEKIEGLMKEESIVNRYGVRVHFIGNLKLLNKSVRVAGERVMEATANNSKVVMSICVAYTSTDEIVNTIQRSCD
ncbi:dehydrodolichyl diphosphate synthase 6-like [Camellia sinensis]|uniref:dehydrodolichyl diphosphate synthase 6-like n=1 Tax=Camellia sinensis TaxID=4442 RepID=UPI0010367D04|nr:dehydrodolichyl diphosphate synthase 6-like [Camellia sinensis]